MILQARSHSSQDVTPRPPPDFLNVKIGCKFLVLSHLPRIMSQFYPFRYALLPLLHHSISPASLCPLYLHVSSDGQITLQIRMTSSSPPSESFLSHLFLSTCNNLSSAKISVHHRLNHIHFHAPSVISPTRQLWPANKLPYTLTCLLSGWCFNCSVNSLPSLLTTLDSSSTKQLTLSSQSLSTLLWILFQLVGVKSSIWTCPTFFCCQLQTTSHYSPFIHPALSILFYQQFSLATNSTNLSINCLNLHLGSPLSSLTPSLPCLTSLPSPHLPSLTSPPLPHLPSLTSPPYLFLPKPLQKYVTSCRNNTIRFIVCKFCRCFTNPFLFFLVIC